MPERQQQQEAGAAHTAIALISPIERGEPSSAAAALVAVPNSVLNPRTGSDSPAASSASSPASSAAASSSSGSYESSSEEDSSSASSSPASSSATSSSPASSYASSPAASALEEGKAAATNAGPKGEIALPGTPFSGKTLDSDVTTLPTTPFRQSCLCRCLGWTAALLTVLGIILGVLVQKHVLWFVMPKVEYEKGGSSFQLTTTGPTGEIGGVQYATDFYLKIGVKVDNPNNYALTFSDVSMALTDFRDAYVGTASHEDMVTVPAKKSKSFVLDAEIHTTLPEIMQIAADCEANGMTTGIQAKGSLRAQIVPNVISVPIKMGPYKTEISCSVNGPDGKPLVGADGHIHLPDHLAAPAAPAPAEIPAAPAAGGEAPAAVAVDANGGVAPADPAAADAADAAAAPAAPPADGAGAGAPPAEPAKEAPAGGGEGAGAPEAVPPAPPADNNGGGGGGGIVGGFMRNVFGWGN